MKEFIKTIVADNARKIEREVEIQQTVAKYGFAPRIVDLHLTYDNNKYTGIIRMEHLDGMSLADMYTDNADKISTEIWDKIRMIIKTLYEKEGIEYIDITGYNFIEKDNHIYIIDFGDAKYTKQSEKINSFLEKFLNGHNGWNPDFY